MTDETIGPGGEQRAGASPKSSRFRWWHAFKSPYWAGIAGIATIVGLAIAIAYSNSNSNSTATPHRTTSTVPLPARDILDQIAKSSIWTRSPQAISSATVQIGGDSSGQSEAAVEFGEPEAFTPSELVDKAASWAGTPVYLVGRVTHIRDVEDAFGLGKEVELAVENNEEAVIGAPSSTDVRVGEVFTTSGRSRRSARHQPPLDGS